MFPVGAEAFDGRDVLARRALIGVTQLRVASPSTWTVHAPHRPTPQPNLVPVSSSRRAAPEQRHRGIAIERAAHSVYREADH